MNLLPPDLHDHVVFCLLRGDATRKIARETGVSKGTIQIRKNMLVMEGYSFPRGRVREQPSTVHAARAHAVRDAYEQRGA